MQDFMKFKNAVNTQFDSMTSSASELFYVELDRNELWELYLKSFPEGTNPIHLKRTEHDCACCKTFIRQCGGVVAFDSGKLVSIWDVPEVVGDIYKPVADALSAYIKGKSVKNIFRHFQRDIGTDKNHQMLENSVVTWNHFHYKLPSKYYLSNRSVDTVKGEALTNYQTLESSMQKINKESISIVLDLIAQNSIYRGEEFLKTVELIRDLKKQYEKITTDIGKQEFLWKKSTELGSVSNLKNTVIGTLLTDLSEGYDLEDCVKSFESKVAPTNYKRSKSLVSKKMIEDAENTVVDLGISESLYRRYAKLTDITVDNVLFADRTAQKAMKGLFDQMKDEAAEKAPNLDKVEEVTVENFIEKILPTATSIEVFFENEKQNNLMSLIAPVHADARNIFKWGNNFSWSYNGDVTDTIKERVKRAGGNVTGVLRCSLSWSNYDDLDIHLNTPKGGHIFFGNKRDAATMGVLDVDMNAGGGHSRTPVENITFPDLKYLKEGDYRLVVNNFSKRETKDGGFEVEIEFQGTSYFFSQEHNPSQSANVEIAVFNYSKNRGLTIVKSLPEKKSSKEIWGISTQKFHRASVILNSPNHWDGQKTGNRHLFFILDKCKNPDEARGFYNEFLTQDLDKHRKVFEILGSKMKVEESDEQLSGLGFSSTLKASVICRVKGSFNRTIKVQF
jgi:hypothetical protein